MNNDTDIIEPSIEPATRKIALRNVSAVNAATTRTDVQVRDFPLVGTDEPASLGGGNSAPSPMEMVLVALVGCDGVIINGVASAMGFKYSGVKFRCEGQIDVRGPKGVAGVRPYYESILLDIDIFTDETEKRFLQLQKNVEFRCPVMNLLRSARVDLLANWTRYPAQDFVPDVGGSSLTG